MEEATQQPGKDEVSSILGFPLRIPELLSLKNGGFILSGTATLVSGVATVTSNMIRATSIAIVSYNTPAGTMGANVKAVSASGSVTITAVKADKTTETSDTSTVNYLIIL